MKKPIGFERRLRVEEGQGGEVEAKYPEMIRRPDQYDLWFDDQFRSTCAKVYKIRYRNRQMCINDSILVFHPDVPAPMHFLYIMCQYMQVDLSEWMETAAGHNTTIESPTGNVVLNSPIELNRKPTQEEFDLYLGNAMDLPPRPLRATRREGRMVSIEEDINRVLSTEPANTSAPHSVAVLADAPMTIPEDTAITPAVTIHAPTEALLNKANAQGLNSLVDVDVCAEVAESVCMYAAHLKELKTGAEWLGPAASMVDPDDNKSDTNNASAQTAFNIDKVMWSEWKHLSDRGTNACNARPPGSTYQARKT